MQYARRTTIGSSQGYAAGILLANKAPGRTRNDMYMQQLSNTSSRAKKPSTSANPNHRPVAVLQRGIDIAGPFPEGSVDTIHNDEELRLNLDLLEEKRERAVICEAKAKMKMTKYYNARVHGVAFRPGDFVYRINNASHAADGGKLRPKWKGPYEVTEALGGGAYKLRTMAGADLPRTWNIANLKKCYL
ncbi:hypothetical protein Tco_1145835 [Tanacetum coccineum]